MASSLAGDAFDRDALFPDEVDLARAQEYRLIAALMSREPKAELLGQAATLHGDATPLGLAHIALAEAARAADADAVAREYFDLFIGLGQGEFLPYGSYYMAGFLHDRPLARLRQDLADLGLERARAAGDPEDHIAILCEAMAGLADGTFPASPAVQKRFFERHLQPWATRLFADIEMSARARFYKSVARVGGLFMEIETQAFQFDA